MMISTGCTILRDAKGNPGEMIIHRREATQAEVDALCRRWMDVAGKIMGDRQSLRQPATGTSRFAGSEVTRSEDNPSACFADISLYTREARGR